MYVIGIRYITAKNNWKTFEIKLKDVRGNLMVGCRAESAASTEQQGRLHLWGVHVRGESLMPFGNLCCQYMKIIDLCLVV